MRCGPARYGPITHVKEYLEAHDVCDPSPGFRHSDAAHFPAQQSALAVARNIILKYYQCPMLCESNI